LVLNNDKLSFSEAFRIKKKLDDIGINIESIIINKSKSKAIPDEVRDEFNHQKIALFPFSSKDILGYQAINEYLDENSEIFPELSKGGHHEPKNTKIQTLSDTIGSKGRTMTI
jgi:hypothetical protein